jgi:hypothetical protein
LPNCRSKGWLRQQARKKAFLKPIRVSTILGRFPYDIWIKPNLCADEFIALSASFGRLIWPLCFAPRIHRAEHRDNKSGQQKDKNENKKASSITRPDNAA